MGDIREWYGMTVKLKVTNTKTGTVHEHENTNHAKQRADSMKPAIRKLVEKVALEIDPDVEVRVLKI